VELTPQKLGGSAGTFDFPGSLLQRSKEVLVFAASRFNTDRSVK